MALYGQRLRVEIDYRHVKTTLEMEQFEVKTSDMFRKELAAGLLTYNLICALMVKAAQIGHLLPSQLSFARCWRRIRDTLFQHPRTRLSAGRHSKLFTPTISAMPTPSPTQQSSP